MGVRLPPSSGIPDSELGPEQQVEACSIPELAEGSARTIRSSNADSLKGLEEVPDRTWGLDWGKWLKDSAPFWIFTEKIQFGLPG